MVYICCMNKIAEIFKANKHVIIWTVAYIAIVWAILLFMFNFNIFVGHQWQLLMRAEIKGFAGFVFGILMLAALPMYIATTAIIIRTKQPLITINIKPVTKIFTAIIPHPVPTDAITSAYDTTPQITKQPDNTKDTQSGDEFPNTMPQELRGAFMRARQHIDHIVALPPTQIPVAQNTAPTVTTPEPETGDLPLPSDFGFDSPDSTEFTPDISMPTFTDINFGDDDNDDTNTQPADDTPAPITDNDNNPVIDYLAQHGCTPRRNGDLIIANDIIIATHDDPDFWIADPDNWFATGKQIPSPITHLIKASAQHGLRPVLYLAQTNIMDLDARRTEWNKMGVTTVTDLSELPL